MRRPIRRVQGVSAGLTSGLPFLLAPQQIVDQCWGAKGTRYQAATLRFLGLAYTTLGATFVCGASEDCGPKTRKNLLKVALVSGIANMVVNAEARKLGMNPMIADSITGATIVMGAVTTAALLRKD